jgi:uroporphyrinogen III methyltransferase/synthase
LATVVLTRQPDDNRELAQRLARVGYAVTEAPCLEIVTQIPTDDEAARLRHVQPDAVTFSSKHGVAGFFDWQDSLPPDQRLTRPGIVGAVGPKTAQHIQKRGWQVDIVAEPATGEELAWRLLALTPMPGILLAVRGDTSRDGAARLLGETGWRVLSATVYRNLEPPIAAVVRGDILVFASPSAARRFLTRNPHLRTAHCVAIGSSTAAYLAEAGLETITAQGTDDDALFAAIQTIIDSHA